MTAPAGQKLRLEGISHRFGAATAMDGVDLGPWGCGKSTLLRVIAGFIAQTQGRVLFDNAAVDHLSPRHRGVGIVFQNYALFPHMTVRRNVAYGLEAQGYARNKIAMRVDEMLDFVQNGGQHAWDLHPCRRRFARACRGRHEGCGFQGGCRRANADRRRRSLSGRHS